MYKKTRSPYLKIKQGCRGKLAGSEEHQKAEEEAEEDEEKSTGEEMFDAADAAISGILSGDKDSLEKAKDSVADAMMRIPYLKEVMLGAEFANLAFKFAAKHAPPGAKREIGAAFQTVVMGRFEALRDRFQDDADSEPPPKPIC